MAVPSTMVALGTRAPDFSLPNVSTGQSVSLSTFADKKALLVMFICRHCPYVQHVKNELTRIGNDYKDRKLGIVAIASNDPQAYPQDAPTSMAEFAKEEGFTFPVCFDESQEFAKSYKAACTPDFFLYDSNRKLVYRGQLDDTRPSSDAQANGKDLRAAIDAVLADKPVSNDQKPSTGCSIKWRPGNEPTSLDHDSKSFLIGPR
ncbi:thioredoxin family protein [Candidatus Gottesmanbacteria bacterium]|nr:thioredoxin family protein [Candidatus Gottesmanbacteria bacterium]